MRVVVLSTGTIPGFNVRGPILSPTEYDIHLILRWISLRLDVREVMEDGSYRKLKSNDPKLLELLDEKIQKETKKREEMKKLRIDNTVYIDSRANVKLKPERLPKQKPIPQKINKPKKEEPPKVEVKEEELVTDVKENDIELFIDELEKPE